MQFPQKFKLLLFLVSVRANRLILFLFSINCRPGQSEQLFFDFEGPSDWYLAGLETKPLFHQENH